MAAMLIGSTILSLLFSVNALVVPSEEATSNPVESNIRTLFDLDPMMRGRDVQIYYTRDWPETHWLVDENQIDGLMASDKDRNVKGFRGLGNLLSGRSRRVAGHNRGPIPKRENTDPYKNMFLGVRG